MNFCFDFRESKKLRLYMLLINIIVFLFLNQVFFIKISILSSIFTILMWTVLLNIYSFNDIESSLKLSLKILLCLFFSVILLLLLKIIFIFKIRFMHSLIIVLGFSIVDLLIVLINKFFLVRSDNKYLVITKQKAFNNFSVVVNKYKLNHNKTFIHFDNSDIGELKEKIKLVDKIIIDNSICDQKYINDIYKLTDNHKDIYKYIKHNDKLYKKEYIINDNKVFSFCKYYSPTIFDMFFKRVLDISLSIIVILLLFPLFIIIPILIKLEDGGSVFYYQKRTTINQEEFAVIKFRTMIPNAEKVSGAVLSSKDDYRITKVGKILRMTKLDEIPQVFNCLKGEMSIVGPRPERMFFVNEFIKETPQYARRFVTKAGITGLAQINLPYEANYKEKLVFDLAYVSNYSLWLDIKIIFNTIYIVLYNIVFKVFEDNKEEIISSDPLFVSLEKEG